MGNKESHYKKWVKTDLRWLKANYKKFTYKEIANKLGRTELAIKGTIIAKGWAKSKPKWSRKEVLMLKKYYKKIEIDKLAKKLGRSKDSILCKIRRLNSDINVIKN